MTISRLDARLVFSAALIFIGSLTISGSTAQSTPPLPTVDLRLGPIATASQAVNIALALSVEFPTVGAAYRTAKYDEAITYLGYFDPKGCYNYKDLSASAPVISTGETKGEYFYRTGTVSASGYCDHSGSLGRYSGNALNYITTSSIDLLRYALTGGNRVWDDATSTVLGRAYLYSSWNLHNGTYFPAKLIPQSLVGKVIPPLVTGKDVYAGGCKDKVWFGTSNASVTCDTAGATTSGNLNPTETTGTVTVTKIVEVPAGSAAPSGGTLTETGVWVITNPLQTTTTAPTSGSPVTYTDTPVPTGGETTNLPPTPVTPAEAFIRNDYVTNGLTSTTPPAAPAPTTVVSTTDVPFATRYFIYPAPPASGPYRTLSFRNNDLNVCRTNSNSRPNGFKALLSSDGNTFKQAPNGSCGSGDYSGYPSRGKTADQSWSVYEPLNTVNVYALYDKVPIYKAYSMHRDYDVYRQVDRYEVETTGTETVTIPSTIYARVRVCDSIEAATRTDLCKVYPDGNYKPIGEIQRNAKGTRISAFGYLADNADTRYGGVLRAPMKYPGPDYIDPAGQPQTNSQSEWSANNGVFAVNPMGATEGISGVINYLNKFGTTGTLGNYKGLDPVGELYYEALRYFQGLGPSATSTANPTTGITTAMKDGFPVTTTWTDPVPNACARRNFILTIGDVNTHYDKQLPGHMSSTGVNSFLTQDPARAAVSIPGSTDTFNSVTWTNLLTGFETNTSISYTDAQGRAQNTLGNPNPNTSNTNLATKATGSGGHSAYYWAGAAYWANTQPIRRDFDSTGLSMKDVRVKTFTIDVDEGGNGLIDGNTRGIAPRQSSFYLAGKYGWFNDSNLDGNPFKASGGLTNNSEWEDASAANTPDGYVIASQANKMISGIRKFFQAASSQRGTVTVSAVSTSRFTASSVNGDFFAPQFNPADWSGTVQKSNLKLNTTTGTVESTAGVIWDAGAILSSGSRATSSTGPYVIPADRNIITMSMASEPTGVYFDVAHKTQLDTAVLTALSTNPQTGSSDGLVDARINWLRGDHSNEQSSTSGTLRQRTNIMGDVINSGPVYKQSADSGVTGAGYGDFAASVAGRQAMIYVGANDGMLHGFRASDGKELLAYIPNAIATNLNKLTNPNYSHLPFVDGIPSVSEANVQGNWKTVLVSGLGGGAQGVFAVDVTHPESFSTANVMFEFTDKDDADMGNVMIQPVVVKLKTPNSGGTGYSYKWYVAVGSGYNNYQIDGHQSTTGAQAMFFLSLDKPIGETWTLNQNYFKIVLPVSSTSMANGLMNPGFAKGAGGEATMLYAGDLQGNLWKFDLIDGISSTLLSQSVLKSGANYVPLFKATTGDTTNAPQPITTTPQVVEANAEGYMVVFGTGKFVEPNDTSTTNQQAIYGIWDSLETTASAMEVPRNKLFQRTATLSGTTVDLDTGLFSYGTSNSTTSGTYRGWYLNMPATRERIVVEPSLGFGIVGFRATIPDGSCAGDGGQRSYCLNPVFGTSLGCDMSENSGNPSAPEIFEIALDQPYSTRKPSGLRTVTINQQIVGSSTKITDAGNVVVYGQNVNSVSIPAGRISWRELR